MKWSISFISMMMLAACAPVGHHERYAAVHPNTVEVEAGSVRSDAEARSLCPSVCGNRGWTGGWRQTGDDHRAVCECSAGGVAAPLSPAQPATCSAQGNGPCAGCSISCPTGQQAQCAEGVAQQGMDAAVACVTPARCLCQ